MFGFGCYLVFEELRSWYYHWILASLIGDWYQRALKAKLKAAKLRPQPWPPPGKLHIIPAHLLVFTAIMQTAWAASL